ncbi:fimbrial adapter PapF precursor [Escherichia coli]|nr:fimbrial adapter PapF precursor [Escherichia coli]
MSKISSILISSVLTGAVMLSAVPVGAVDLKIEITGKVEIPPCKTSENKIEVNFKDISLYEVDGKNYKQTKTVTLNCEYKDKALYVYVTGLNLAGAPDNVVKTTSKNLGIALYQGDDLSTPLKLKGKEVKEVKEVKEAGYKITKGLSGKQFTFTAVPYKTGELTAGEFSATATLTFHYW